MSSVRTLSGAALVVCCLLLAGPSVSVSGEGALQNNTLYSFEQPSMSNPNPVCGSDVPLCIYQYAPFYLQNDQEWDWNNGGLARQGSAFDPIGQTNYQSPPDGVQFAFIQNLPAFPSTYMTAQAVLNAGWMYYVRYSAATRANSHFDSTTVFTLSYNGVVISQPEFPSAERLWSNSANPVLSNLFTASASGTMQFAMSVTAPSPYLDQTVLIDALTIIPLVAALDVSNGFEVPVLASGGYAYSPSQDIAGQPWTWTTGGIARSGSPWDPQGGVVYDGSQYAFVQVRTFDGIRTSSMSAYLTLNPGSEYTFSFYGGSRDATSNLNAAELKVDLITLGGPRAGQSQRLFTKAAGFPYPSAFNNIASTFYADAAAVDAQIVFTITYNADGIDAAWLLDEVKIVFLR